MKTIRLTGGAVLAAALFWSATAAPAQQVRRGTSALTVAPPTPDADALAEQMRILASDPKNADALIKAGELTLKLGDPTAAAVLFSRAEDVRPRDGRLKADEAAVLVHMERPGEALRLFQQAEAMGAKPADFAAERGLAYDLIGQQERAQRDYRTALAADPNNAETMRRYALSLGISGKRDQALAEIDPLVRKQDHAGWRDRAFILAMTGDPDQAEKIANAMLPPAMASGLAPFFQRLPQLSAVDRAFAVHFGEVAATPQRLADARLIPPLPPLASEPETAPTQLAAAAPPPAETRAQRRAREKAERDAAKAAKKQQAAAARTTTDARGTASTASQPGSSAPPESRTRPVQLAVAKPIPVTLKPAPATLVPAPAIAASQTAPTSAAVEPPVKPAVRVGQEDDILRKIMAGISVPASEMGETPQAAPQPVPAAPPRQLAAAKPAPDPAAEAKRLEAANLAAVKKAAEEKAAAEAKAEAQRKAAAEKKAAEAKKAADAKAAAKKKAEAAAAKANPSRIWVQVAGGANEGDLPKAWARVKAKAPHAFKGKQGWSTPLNATNRVLAGPFKSDEAAQDFVNALKKEGVSAFPFTSAKGQKIDKLPAK
ncbi:MAG TPA: SPOR domain-containing protein [Sphingomonas sp.]|nr:SPOR domain-containing protein [Sphingomonas sp.]